MAKKRKQDGLFKQPVKNGNSSKKLQGRKFSRDNVDTFIDYGINIDNRIIHLFDNIDNDTSSKVIKGIQLMMIKNKTEPIHIYINSFGGCVYSSFAIYDFIRSQKEVEIYTYNCGSSMSGGSIVYMAGHKRFMYKNSVLMLHSVASMAEGKVFLELDIETEECKKLYKQMCELYARHGKEDFRYWYRTLKFIDKYYRADECVNLGFVDEIIE